MRKVPIICLLTAYVSIASARDSNFGPEQLAVVINQLDPLSIKIGEYYAERRQIPMENIIRIKFNPGNDNMSADTFKLLRWRVVSKTPEYVQAYALTWAEPYKVDGCMSITTAFAYGFDKAFCGGCNRTKENPYFNSESRQPYNDFKWRPTMSITAIDFEKAKELIDRGVQSDYSHPKGTAYLMNTPDTARNGRAVLYPQIIKTFKDYINVQRVDGYRIEDKSDILFYVTGQLYVTGQPTILTDFTLSKFLPGAIADHLTSTGGELTTNIANGNTSALRWIEAGATGSYGTVVEPCNYLQKFPNPGIAMYYYLKGETLIEAYWKSVAWPGQGIFIGEPLAKPFAKRPN